VLQSQMTQYANSEVADAFDYLVRLPERRQRASLASPIA
jgi:hypothetical protein